MRRANKANAAVSRAVLDAGCLPQTPAAVRDRVAAVGIKVEVYADLSGGQTDGEMLGLMVQAPGTSGAVRDT